MSASGPIDADTARSIESGRQTLGAILKTAQNRLKVVFVAFVVGLFAGVIAMRLYIWPTLKRDLLARGAAVIAQTPFDVILLQVKIGLAVGIIFALPVLLYYSKRPLAERGLIPDLHVPRWKLAIVALMAVFLSTIGIVYAYFLFFPIMFTFLAGNALGAGLAPLYSIVHWTEFILVLALSFGLAAQLPLLMTALSYTEIVPYETFRDKWKYAVIAIFSFGAMFSPPDPFTQLMWAFPLLLLYAFSLYLSKLVTAGKRGRRNLDFFGALRRRLHRVAGTAVLGGGLVYWFYGAGGLELFNGSIRPALPTLVRPGPVPSAAAALGLSQGLALLVVVLIGAVVFAILGALVVLYRATMQAQPEDGLPPKAATGEPAPESEESLPDIDEVEGAEAVRALPIEVFAGMSEESALAAAQRAMDDGDPEKAEAIFERFDDAPEELKAEEESGGTFSQTTAGMVNAFTEEETTEGDIGGYYHDIAFILDSLRSRSFHLIGIFMVVMAGLFMFLYRGGIGTIRADFISRIPPEVRPDPAATQWPITLHPVEALVFEVKISMVIAAIVTLPVLFYYAWPALSERGIIRGDRRAVSFWGISIILGILAGSIIGYLYVAPPIISYLVEDAIRAGMVVSYRVNNFFWMVFFTTAGVGLLADIPISMWLFHRGGIISYERMRRSWRGVVLVIFVFSTFFSSSSIWTMFLLAVPTSAAYVFGLGVLWVVTLGGRRGGKPRAAEPA
ncbi:preprotein translocase subunit TatC [Halodesulfurarchaeum formicicum]|uniref:Sec-independent protein translocase protein TatC n=1 Tax=Halodesulfurarchaeum formicicum TaxID=1873524 RepID=A0A1D8S716_9EURY|nr:twin-arginine translocase subunit TatC [Halodesulfurarchaeum formicicum]AOW81152.1 preprotein translocase subunit TatC [Halodesulfurarchaeum formicicum]